MAIVVIVIVLISVTAILVMLDRDQPGWDQQDPWEEENA